jgi:electron transport complex protein RnfG
MTMMDQDGSKPAIPPVPGMPVESPSSFRMILTMGGIGLFAGILIVLTFQMTFPIIKVNKTRYLESAIFEVVPGASEKATFKLVDGMLERVSGEDDTAVKYYACYDESRRLVGVAVEAAGQGFQDVVRVLYGYSPQCDCIVGLKVLESKETPGLGTKIETDPEFRSNFEALDVRLDTDRTGILNPVEMVKHGKKTDAWQVEAITGATISSRAIAKILRESSAVAVPLIAKNRTVLEGIQ